MSFENPKDPQDYYLKKNREGKVKRAEEFDADKKAKMSALLSLSKEMDKLMGDQVRGVKSVEVEVEPKDGGIEMEADKAMIEKKMDDDMEQCSSSMDDEEKDPDSIFARLKKCR